MTYTIKIPIAGHLTFEIEATSKAEAIEAAWKADSAAGELSYELLERFQQGNTSHCPPPWEVTADSE